MPDAKKVVLTDEAINDLDRLDQFLRVIDLRLADRLSDTFQRELVKISQLWGIGRPWAHRDPGEDVRERVVRFGSATYILGYRVFGDVLTMVRIYSGRENP